MFPSHPMEKIGKIEFTMKPTRQLLLAAAISALLGACSRQQPPETKQTASPPASNVDARTANTAGDMVKVSGTVTDAAGKPLAGATVEYWDYPGPMNEWQKKNQSVTRADGAFAVEETRSTGFLLARRTGLAPAWKQLTPQINPAGETDVRLALTPPSTLAGVVVDESNQPVTNAEVFAAIAVNEILLENGGRSFSYLRGKLARDTFGARTDKAGHFRIEDFPGNVNAMLAVSSPGKTLRQTASDSISIDSLPFHAGQQDIQLVVEPAGVIEGKIVAEGGAQPLPIARLTLQPNQPGLSRVGGLEPVQSDADGAFRISDVPAGSYFVRAVFGTNALPDWVAEAVAVSVESGQIARGVQMTAQRGGVLEVAVVGEGDRKPVAQASVTARTQNLQFSTTARSEANGIARLRLVPGDYQISAFRPPASSSQTSVAVKAGATNRVEIEIAGPQKITGIVRQPGGQPAAGVPVRLIGPGGFMTGSTKTDATGKFELEWDPRRVVWNNSPPCILARDAEHNLSAALDTDEGITNVDLKLAPALALAGRVECDGKPVTNATAALVFWTGRSGMYLYGLARTNTPTPGQFEIPALPPGRRYGVVVTAPGYGRKQLNSFEASADAGRQDLDSVELKLANLKLAGQVLDADNNPVAGCSVSISGNDQPSANVRTDRNGRFAFERVCEGTVRLSASCQQTRGNISAEGGDMSVVLRLDQTYSSSSGAPMHKLKGAVTDAEGKPVAGAQVAVFPASGSRQWVKTGQNGEYNLTWSLQSWQMQRGGALLVVRDAARDLAAVVDLSDDATNLDVRLKPALTLAGQVKAVGDSPLHNAQVGLWLKAGNSYENLNEQMATVNAEGRFEIKCLPPEPQYLVYASASGFGRNQQQVGPDAGTNRLDLDPFVLKPADRVVAGQVLDANDKPVSGVNASLMNVIAPGGGQPEGSVTTDRNGQFRLQVCEGQVRLYANSQNGNGYAQASVEAGDTNIVINLRSSSGIVSQPQRASLKGSLLPDLTGVNLATDAAPAGQPVLLCLFDAGQRPSRHVLQQLETQSAALRQKNVRVLGVQAVQVGDDVFNGWKTASPVSFPVGRVTDKSAKTKWASDVSVFPWLILADANHRVAAEGFSVDVLEAEIQKMK
jgi:protocatechuate 3,4-dioxygenase beta subunit